MSQGGCEPLLILKLFYQSTPSCLQVMGGVMGGQCDFSVSPSPFGLDSGTFGLWTSDLGLTKMNESWCKFKIHHCWKKLLVVFLTSVKALKTLLLSLKKRKSSFTLFFRWEKIFTWVKGIFHVCKITRSSVLGYCPSSERDQPKDLSLKQKVLELWTSLCQTDRQTI